MAMIQTCELADDVIVEKLCRFCLNKEEDLVPIFDNKGSAPLAIRIRACLNLEILENDELPKNICVLCHYHLEKYDEFRKSCEISEQKIRQHLSQLRHYDDKELISEQTDSAGVITEKKESLNEENREAMKDTGQGPVTSSLEMQSASISTKRMIHLNHGGRKQEDAEQCSVRVVDALQSALVAGGLGRMSEGVLSLPNIPSTQYPLTMHVLQRDGSLLIMDIVPDDEDPPSREPPSPPEVQVETVQATLSCRCCECGLGFPSRLLLQRHLSLHTQNRGISCALCQKWFPSRSSLLRHERTHTGERPFACPDCPRRFAQKEILQRHKHIHLPERPFECEDCGSSFTQKAALHSHKRSHTPPSSRGLHLHHCSVCPKVFCYASGLSRHILTHKGRVYPCLECNATFNDKSSSKRHARVTGHSLT